MKIQHAERVVLLAALALSACAAHAKSSAAPAAPPVNSAKAAPTANGVPGGHPFGAHCAAKSSSSGDALLVACQDKQILFLLPGAQWNLEPSTAPELIVHASAGMINVSVRVAPEQETQFDLGEHLKSIYEGSAVGLAQHGFTAGEPHLERAEHGHVVLVYEVTTPSEPLRMVNVWTAMRRVGGRYVDYHLSITTPADDPRWNDAEKGPEHVAVNLADAFFVNDGKGNLPPQ